MIRRASMRILGHARSQQTRRDDPQARRPAPRRAPPASPARRRRWILEARLPDLSAIAASAAIVQPHRPRVARRSMASIPASASSPRSRSRPISSRRCSTISCSRIALALGRRSATMRCASPWRSRSTAWRRRARGCGRSSSMRCWRLLEQGIYPVIPSKGSVGASGDFSRRSPILRRPPRHRRGSGATGTASCRPRRGWRRPGSRRCASRPRKGWRCSTARRSRPPWRCLASSPPRNALAAAVVAGRAHHRRTRAAATRRSIPASMPSAASAARASSPRPIARCSPAAQSAPAMSIATRCRIPIRLRCQPQVMGACLDTLRPCRRHLRDRGKRGVGQSLGLPEARAAEPGEGVVALGAAISTPSRWALAADTLALAIAEIGALSERRIALLIDAG